MKIIKYKYISSKKNVGTKEQPIIKNILSDKEIYCQTDTILKLNEGIAKKEAYNGEYIIEDDGIEEISTPSQLDIIEAQVTYTAMMTDTLLEV